MNTQSIWIDETKRNNFPELKGEHSADVVIIGGGICGVTAAQLLVESGNKVILLESHRIGESNTGRSTGNIYGLTDIFSHDIEKKYDRKKAKQVIESRLDALRFIIKNIESYSIECDFVKVPWIRFSADPSMDAKIEEEFLILKELNFDVKKLDHNDSRLMTLGGRVGILVEDQGQFNPYYYVSHLASAIRKKCSIYEESAVTEIEHQDDMVLVRTTQGTVRAKFVIEATHTPLGISHLQTLVGPYREYGIASPFKGDLPRGIYWGYYEKDKVTSVRTYEKEGSNYLLTIGEPHKVGQRESLLGFERLKDHARAVFNVGEPVYQWGGQHYRPADLLPYIGRKDKENHLLATGFSTDGLVYGTLSAQILTGEILGTSHPYAELYSSTRITPVKSMSKFVQENLNVAQQYLKDYLKSEEFHHLAPGQGMVVKLEGHRLAISKNEHNETTVCSAVCPHLGGIVHWNHGEQSWDCPCHGSRFNNEGQVIEGPALSGLKRFNDMQIQVPTSDDEYKPSFSLGETYSPHPEL